MSACKYLAAPAAVVGSCLAAFFTATMFLHTGIGTALDGPKTLEDVLAVADQLGWHCRTDRADGSLHRDPAGLLRDSRVILSQSPLTWEDTCGLVLGMWEQRDWRGKIAVYPRRRLEPATAESAGARVWGDMYLFGDSQLIDRLIGNDTD